MAPEITAAPAVAVTTGFIAQDWERSLAQSVATKLKQPEKTPAEIVDDLLGRLQDLRRRRDLKGVNHWEEVAPGYLEQLATRAESRRRFRAAKFLEANVARAFRQAFGITKDRREAEDAVAETALELLEGRTTEGRFYRALWGNATNRFNKGARQAKLIDSLDAHPYVADADGIEGPGDQGIAYPSKQLVSNRRDDRDPLEILLEREDVGEALRISQTDRNYRWMHRTKWWQALAASHGVGTKTAS